MLSGEIPSYSYIFKIILSNLVDLSEVAALFVSSENFLSHTSNSLSVPGVSHHALSGL